MAGVKKPVTHQDIEKQKAAIEMLMRVAKMAKINKTQLAAALGVSSVTLSYWQRFYKDVPLAKYRMTPVQLRLACAVVQRVDGMLRSRVLPLDASKYGGVRSVKYHLAVLHHILLPLEELHKL